MSRRAPAAYPPRRAPATVALPLSPVQQAANCEALADFLEHEVPDAQFGMRNYARPADWGKPERGTAACGLGWAALSGAIPGYSWTPCAWLADPTLDASRHVQPRPTLNGRVVSFIDYGQSAALFGARASHAFHRELHHTRLSLVAELRRAAAGLRS